MVGIPNVIGMLGVTAWGRSLTNQEKKNFEAFALMIQRAEGIAEDHASVSRIGDPWRVQQGYKDIGTFNRSHPDGCTQAYGRAIGPFQIEGPTWCDMTKGELAHCRNRLDSVCQMSVFIQILKSARTYHTCATTTVKGKKARRCRIVRTTTVSAYDDILAGRFVDAMKKLNGRYSSMPESSSPTKDPLLAGMYAPKIKFITDHGGMYVKGVLG